MRHAFTLIELLVVILIIGILAGLLFPVFSQGSTNAKKADTRATFGVIEAAITRYKLNNNGVHPLDDGSSWVSNNGMDRMSQLITALGTVDRDSFGTAGSKIRNNQILDGWDKPIRYRPFIAYPTGQYLYDVNPDSYQIWSVGPDGVDQTADGNQDTGDDLTNWGN